MSHAVAKLDFADAPAAQVRRTLYYPALPGGGYMYACTKKHSGAMQWPFLGLLAITADRSTINIALEGKTVRHRAVAVCAREMRLASDVTRLVFIVVNPLHPLFRAFTALPKPGVLRLDRALFSCVDELLELAVDGVLSHEQAVSLFDKSLSIVSNYLPSLPEIDPRAQELVKLLWARPKCSVTELAEHLGLSYHRTSHLFSEAVGIPVRTYQLWRKIDLAGMALVGGASITEAAHSAGFHDSAHFSSAYQRAYASSPSKLYMNKHIKVYAPLANSKPNSQWLVKR